mmetsp:Transcript_45250/g.109531  ORF Transcript_45250/g.109531 Transcript_45250/m.109531 type:complete len:252 (+) Transcript_45250:151-906(+)
MFLTHEQNLIQTATVLNTIGPSQLPPRLQLTPLGEEEKESEDAFFSTYEPMDHPAGSKRLKAMQRAHARRKQATQRNTATVAAVEASNANRVPFHTNNPYIQMGFWSYLAYNMTDPCCGTSEWIYQDNDDYDGDFDDVDVDDNGLFWRDYNPKRELHSLQLQVENSNLSERKRSYLEKKIEIMQRDPLEFDFDDDDEENETLMTMDESVFEGNMSGMEAAVRKFKKFEREQRYIQEHYYGGAAEIHTTYSF